MSIHIALAKGRIHKVVMKYLMESGYEFPELLHEELYDLMRRRTYAETDTGQIA